MNIEKSRLWKNLKVVKTILLNTPHLDPTTILSNPTLYFLKKDNKIVSFLALKKHKGYYELKSLYTYSAYRNNDYAKKMIKSVKQRPIVLQCNAKLEKFYNKSGFRKIKEDKYKFLGIKTRLFNNLLSYILGYKIIMMEKS